MALHGPIGRARGSDGERQTRASQEERCAVIVGARDSDDYEHTVFLSLTMEAFLAICVSDTGVLRDGHIKLDQLKTHRGTFLKGTPVSQISFLTLLVRWRETKIRKQIVLTLLVFSGMKPLYRELDSNRRLRSRACAEVMQYPPPTESSDRIG